MNKKQITVEEFQKTLLLPAMKYFDSVCKELNIKYFLAFGTLLGAVRHKGFIPWDDDVDYYVFREDYYKLKEYFLTHESKYTFKDMDEIDTFPSLGRLYDMNCPIEVRAVHNYLHLDVFILDKCPIDQGEKVKKELLHLKKLYTFTKEKLEGMAPYNPQSRKLLKINKFIPFTMLLNTKKIKERIINLLSKWNDLQVDNYLLVDYFFFERIGLLDNKYFENAISHSFEDTEFLIPEGYDSILTKQYGDYMTPPPEDKRFRNPISLLEE